MSATDRKSIDFAGIQTKLASEFKDLNPKDPSLWPAIPRYMLFAGVVIVTVIGLWFAWLSSSQETLKIGQETELKLREDFKVKMSQAVNLDELKMQRQQVQQYVTQLEKQLPSKSEMDALLSDINQAGLGRSLQFDLFRPGQVVVNEYYAELPISIKVSGRYHDIGSFASDIANLSRIVTLNNLSINPRADAILSMDATAKTFRYLDPDEILAQRKATPNGAKK
jgi:type IV pilus assembly protein PilO